MLVNLNEVLPPAQKNARAVGAFNIYSLETASAVFKAAERCKSPVIFAFGEKYIDTANIEVIAAMVKDLTSRSKLPMVLHLDHCKNIEVIYRAVRAGFTSVMFDGSSLDMEENTRQTRKVVEFAHSVGVTVEAELGSVPFDHDGGIITEEYLTKPGEADSFARTTGVDALAVAIGTAHGEYKGKPKIYHERLSEINAATEIPLVMHGGSGVPQEDIEKAIDEGIAKINVNTQISKAAVSRISGRLNETKPPHLADLMKDAETVMTDEIETFIRFFNRQH